MLRKTVQCYWV